MTKSFNKLIQKMGGQGNIGFAAGNSLFGGLKDNPTTCLNTTTCSGTNNTCDNRGDCTGTTNGLGTCVNTGYCLSL